jgi:two-component system chemotaxis response regulator CheY
MITTGILRQMLQELGHKVVKTATTGGAAIPAYVESKPDLITMDIVMPDIDGIEATKRIININPKAWIIMITSVGRETMVAKALNAGARGYVVQPLQKENLADVITKSNMHQAALIKGNLSWVPFEDSQ